MSNIIPFDSTPTGGIATAPAHAIAAFGDAGNIAAKLSINQLSYRGKVWRRVVDGEETLLTRPSADNPGEAEPVPIVSVVVLDHNKARSRAFYEGDFVEGKNAAPKCYSADGVTPDSDVKEPCATTCATCSNSVKGSKITAAGKQSTLCSPFKRVALVPSGKAIAKHPALLLRLAQTSVWDKDNKDNEAKGWYAWDQYLDMLRARGAKHTAMVETRIKFDADMAYPKLMFSAARWLNPDEVEAAKVRLAESADDIATILSGSGERDGVTGQPASSTAPAPQPRDGHPSAPADAALDAAAQAIEEKAAADKAAKAKAAKEAKIAAAKEAADKAAEAARAAAAAAAEDDSGGFGSFGDADTTVAAAKPTAAAADKAPAAAAATPVTETTVVDGTPAALQDLLAGWDD